MVVAFDDDRRVARTAPFHTALAMLPPLRQGPIGAALNFQ